MKCWTCGGTGFLFNETDVNVCLECNGYGVTEATDDKSLPEV